MDPENASWLQLAGTALAASLAVTEQLPDAASVICAFAVRLLAPARPVGWVLRVAAQLARNVYPAFMVLVTRFAVQNVRRSRVNNTLWRSR